MRKYPKIVQMDNRGVIVIPKDVRNALGIQEGTAFWVYAVGKDGLFLQAQQPPDLDDSQSLKDLETKAAKAGTSKKAVAATKKRYKTKKDNLDVIE